VAQNRTGGFSEGKRAPQKAFAVVETGGVRGGSGIFMCSALRFGRMYH